MSFDLNDLDPVLESRMRVGILALLLGGDSVDFVGLRERLDASDGNLSKHLRRLEDAGYVKMKKSIVGRRSHTAYTITPKGKAALESHVQNLAKLINLETAVEVAA